jgi:hypothetical protein
VAVKVTLGTGMSCISSVRRGEDNGSDTEDNPDDGQQRRTPPRLSLPCGNRAIQMDMHARLPLLAHADMPQRYPLLGGKADIAISARHFRC